MILSEKTPSPGRMESKQDVNKTDFKHRVLPSSKYGQVFYVVQSKLKGDAECLHYKEIRISIAKVINTHLALIQQN